MKSEYKGESVIDNIPLSHTTPGVGPVDFLMNSPALAKYKIKRSKQLPTLLVSTTSRMRSNSDAISQSDMDTMIRAMGDRAEQAVAAMMELRMGNPSKFESGDIYSTLSVGSDGNQVLVGEGGIFNALGSGLSGVGEKSKQWWSELSTSGKWVAGGAGLALAAPLVMLAAKKFWPFIAIDRITKAISGDKTPTENSPKQVATSEATESRTDVALRDESDMVDWDTQMLGGSPFPAPIWKAAQDGHISYSGIVKTPIGDIPAGYYGWVARNAEVWQSRRKAVLTGEPCVENHAPVLAAISNIKNGTDEESAIKTVSLLARSSVPCYFLDPDTGRILRTPEMNMLPMIGGFLDTIKKVGGKILDGAKKLAASPLVSGLLDIIPGGSIAKSVLKFLPNIASPSPSTTPAAAAVPGDIVQSDSKGAPSQIKIAESNINLSTDKAKVAAADLRDALSSSPSSALGPTSSIDKSLTALSLANTSLQKDKEISDATAAVAQSKLAAMTGVPYAGNPALAALLPLAKTFITWFGIPMLANRVTGWAGSIFSPSAAGPSPNPVNPASAGASLWNGKTLLGKVGNTIKGVSSRVGVGKLALIFIGSAALVDILATKAKGVNLNIDIDEEGLAKAAAPFLNASEATELSNALADGFDKKSRAERGVALLVKALCVANETLEDDPNNVEATELMRYYADIEDIISSLPEDQVSPAVEYAQDYFAAMPVVSSVGKVREGAAPSENTTQMEILNSYFMRNPDAESKMKTMIDVSDSEDSLVENLLKIGIPTTVVGAILFVVGKKLGRDGKIIGTKSPEEDELLAKSDDGTWS